MGDWASGIRRWSQERFIWLIRYRFAEFLNPMRFPDFYKGKPEDIFKPDPPSLKDIQEKSRASLATVSVLFGLLAAVVAALIISTEFGTGLSSLGSWGTFSACLTAGLMFFIIRQERAISAATTEENEPAKARGQRTSTLVVLVVIGVALFLTFVMVSPGFVKGVTLASGFALILLGMAFLFVALELYDSASGWRGTNVLHYHLASIASNSHLLGSGLVLVGISLSLSLLLWWLGGLAGFISLFVVLGSTEIERDLWDLQPSSSSR